MTTIDVTEEDIKKGLRFNPSSCPVALAVHRAVDYPFVSVTPGVVRIADDVQKPLPRKASRFVNKFDRGGRVKPFSFELDL